MELIDIPFASGEECIPRVAGNLADAPHQIRNPNVRTEFEIINQTLLGVQAIDRRDIRWDVNTEPQENTGFIIIRTRYTISRNTIHKINKAIEESGAENLPPLYQEICDRAEASKNSSTGFRMTYVVVDVKITKETLQTRRTVYVPQCDLVLTIENDDVPIHHPFCIEKNIERRYRDMLSNSKGTALGITIVANNNEIDTRFVYVAKRVMKIIPIKDPDRESGIYVGSHIPTDLGDRYVEERFEFEDAEEKLGLYKTIEEAETGGNPDRLSAVALKEAEIKAINAKMEADQIAHKNATELLDKKKEFEEKKVEIDTTKVERSAYYEERSLERKDKSEAIKFVPAIIGGVVAIWLVVKKLTTVEEGFWKFKFW